MKPIFTKFTGDTEKSKSLMPKARARIKHLAQKGGEFFGGVRIDRSLWDGVEIIIYEYADLYVVRIASPVGEGKEPPRGGVWLIPYDDVAPGGYIGEVELEPQPLLGNGAIYNYTGSWSHKSLDPKLSFRSLQGPSDANVLNQTEEPVDTKYAFYAWKEYGIGRRETTGIYHAPSNSYLSWELGFLNPRTAGILAEDIIYGRAHTYANRYFFNPAGRKLYWGGKPLGGVPEFDESVLVDRSIIGAGMIGDANTVTVILVTVDNPIQGVATYGVYAQNLVEREVRVWKRSFPTDDPQFRWGDDRIDAEGGWVQIGSFLPQAKHQRYVSGPVVGGAQFDTSKSYYYHWYDYLGTAAWNDQPKIDQTTGEIEYYEFSGPLNFFAFHESDVGTGAPPASRVEVPDPENLPAATDYRQRFPMVGEVVSFYTIKITPDLEEITVEWDDLCTDPFTSLAVADSPEGLGYHTFLFYINNDNGWVKSAIDYKDGEKVYFELRKFVLSTYGKDFFNGSNPSTTWNTLWQYRFNGHTFTGNQWLYDATSPTSCDPPFPRDRRFQEVGILGIDMRYDRAWICSYYGQKIGQDVGVCDPEYYATALDQGSSCYMVKGDVLIHMYDELDNPRPLPTPYNLNGDIPRNSANGMTFLQDELGTDVITGGNGERYYTSNRVAIIPCGVQSMWIGVDGSTYQLRDGANDSSGSMGTVDYDMANIQKTVIGFQCMYNGDVICGKKESIYGFAGANFYWEDFTVNNWYNTGVENNIGASGAKTLMWDTLNLNESYTKTFNMPSNDSDCDWIGLIG